MSDRIILKTTAKDENISNNLKQVAFRINPSSLSIDQASLSSLRKTRSGYLKTYQGEGAFTLNFSGVVGVLPPRAENSSGTPLTVQDCPGWKWFQMFAQFVRKNQAYLFQLNYVGAPVMLDITDPVFVGDCSPIRFSQDANNPAAISYSFSFTGILRADTFRTDLQNIEAVQVDL